LEVVRGDLQTISSLTDCCVLLLRPSMAAATLQQAMTMAMVVLLIHVVEG
jgi:hypothetical protein